VQIDLASDRNDQRFAPGPDHPLDTDVDQLFNPGTDAGNDIAGNVSTGGLVHPLTLATQHNTNGDSRSDDSFRRVCARRVQDLDQPLLKKPAAQVRSF
jgi:hypothetical protein